MQHRATTTHLFLAAALLCVLAPDAAPAAASRVVVEEPIIDVGLVAKGEKVAVEFIIRNEGDAPLEITEVKPACGCTVATYDESIAPGAGGSLKAEVRTSSFKGPIAKSITVFTNDAENPRLNLVIKANIQPQIDFHPTYARFITVQGEGEETSVHTLWSDEKPDFEVTGVESPYRFLAVDYRRATKEGEEGEESDSGGKWEVEMTLGAKAPVGSLADFVVVSTNYPGLETLKIPVSGVVRPVLAVAPQMADFGRLELSEPYQASLEVKNMGSKAVSVEGVEVDLQGVEAEVKTIEEGRLFRISLTINPGMAKGEFRGTLKIQTTSSLQPEVEVGLRGTVL